MRRAATIPIRQNPVNTRVQFAIESQKPALRGATHCRAYVWTGDNSVSKVACDAQGDSYYSSSWPASSPFVDPENGTAEIA